MTHRSPPSTGTFQIQRGIESQLVFWPELELRREVKKEIATLIIAQRLIFKAVVGLQSRNNRKVAG